MIETPGNVFEELLKEAAAVDGIVFDAVYRAKYRQRFEEALTAYRVKGLSIGESIGKAKAEGLCEVAEHYASEVDLDED